MDSRVHVGSNILGEGGFAKVYLGTYVIDPNTGKKVSAAIKQVPASKADLEEFQLHAKLSKTPKCHQHVACVYSTLVDNGSYYIIMEYVDGDDLFHEFLATKKEPSDAQLIKIFKDALTGLKFIHDNGIAHGDVKLENLMYDTVSKRVKYIDFGFGCSKRTCASSRVFHGTQYLSPPEASTRKKSLKALQDADRWALGSTFAELLALRRTTEIRLSAATIGPNTDIKNKLKVEAPGHQDKLYTVAAGLMAYSPSQRWSVERALEELQ